MDVVYAHGQEKGHLATQSRFGIVPGTTTNPDFYIEDEVKYHGGQNRAHRVLNLITGQLVQNGVAVGHETYAASTLPGYTFMMVPKPGVALHWKYTSDGNVLQMAVLVEDRSNGWVAVGFSAQGFMLGSKAVLGRLPPNGIGSFVGWYHLGQKDPSGIERLEDPGTLGSAVVSSVDGRLRMDFTLELDEATGVKPPPLGDDKILWAYGDLEVTSSTPNRRLSEQAELLGTLVYHANNRGPVAIDLSGQGDVEPVVDVCDDTTAVFQSAICYASYTQLVRDTQTEFDKLGDYQQSVDLSPDFRISWSIVRDPSEEAHISVMLQGRTLGWLAVGIVGAGVSHGMVNADIWIGHIVNGVAEVRDDFSFNVQAPITDESLGGTNDLYDTGGFENTTTTTSTIWFKRRLVTNDTLDHPILVGETAMIYAFNRQSKDQWSLYHGPQRGYGVATTRTGCAAACAWWLLRSSACLPHGRCAAAVAHSLIPLTCVYRLLTPAENVVLLPPRCAANDFTPPPDGGCRSSTSAGTYVALACMILVGALVGPFLRSVQRVSHTVRRMGATPGMVFRIMLWNRLLYIGSFFRGPWQLVCSPLLRTVVRLYLAAVELATACWFGVTRHTMAQETGTELPLWSRQLTVDQLNALQNVVKGVSVSVHSEENAAPVVGIALRQTLQLSFVRGQLCWSNRLGQTKAIGIEQVRSLDWSGSTPGKRHTRHGSGLRRELANKLRLGTSFGGLRVVEGPTVSVGTPRPDEAPISGDEAPIWPETSADVPSERALAMGESNASLVETSDTSGLSGRSELGLSRSKSRSFHHAGTKDHQLLFVTYESTIDGVNRVLILTVRGSCAPTSSSTANN